MSKLVSIQEAAQISGLSVTSLRRGVHSGRFPATRANSAMGKLMFDPALLEQVLRNEAYANIRNGGGWEAEQQSVFDESFGTDDTEVTMRNVNKLFSTIKKADIDAGMFAPDTLVGRTVVNSAVTSETIAHTKIENKER